MKLRDRSTTPDNSRLLEQSRKWAEEYARIQRRNPLSFLRPRADKEAGGERICITPQQFVDVISWVHFCGVKRSYDCLGFTAPTQQQGSLDLRER